MTIKNAKKVLIATVLVLLTVLSLAACGGNLKFEPYTKVKITPTADAISVSVTESRPSNEKPEFKLNDGDWQDESQFTGLSPNTEYTIYVRVRKNNDFAESEAYSETVKTLKYSVEAAEDITIGQADKTVTLTGGGGTPSTRLMEEKPSAMLLHIHTQQTAKRLSKCGIKKRIRII
ncbi:MAG: hypothetical protein LBP26_04685 [Clostridiales bacterium]|jgi:predicted small lipoprotein YifL|nr:hypothetical protein [Clostridiales bacterium]